MKPTDEERRDVACRLRGIEPMQFDEGELVDCGEVETELGLVSDDGAWYRLEDVLRLADLIEPAPERTCWNKVIKNNKEFPPEYRTDNFICSACGEHFFADSEHINHPIDWAFCPDCGAKVVNQ